jgi:hypothetical protein
MFTPRSARDRSLPHSRKAGTHEAALLGESSGKALLRRSTRPTGGATSTRPGTFVLRPQYTEAAAFRARLAQVMRDDRMGDINRRGEYVWSPR